MKFVFKLLSLAIVWNSPLYLQAQDGMSLLEIRGKHQTKIISQTPIEEDYPEPPKDSGLKLVKYKTDLGDMLAYITPPPKEGEKVPAVIWLTGGFPVASPGSFVWEQTTLENEQTCRVYRYSGLAMMFPTVRGSIKENPGKSEHFYGEVNDVIKAYDYVASLPYVDKQRIYLGGHSTGGTLALLVAESTDKFAGVISLGPVAKDYGKDYATHEWNDTERKLRHPILYLDSIKTPTYIIEGVHGNSSAIEQMKKVNKNPKVKLITVKSADHFNCIHPVNSLFTEAILNSKNGKLDIKRELIEKSYLTARKRQLEVKDLKALTQARTDGTDFHQEQTLLYYFYASTKTDLTAIKSRLQKAGFNHFISKKQSDENGEYVLICVERKLNLLDLQQVFGTSAVCQSIADESKIYYDEWLINK
ncbi:hypothetical protein Rhal01_02048 [Rubritalea halochordaticola]|uniref:Peptidase S9 prolyl oligopeptidase catalytic domain-containing protein n=1 Tax=Rubritalea halochordaticola TaxID=714537 RepID=A0ABP9UZR5_9BACT